MMELRKRVLESGFVLLEWRQLECQFGDDGRPDIDAGPVWGEWAAVPYVDKAGNPLTMDNKTGRIGD